jgi:DNA mismatch repair protein MutL
VNNRIEILSDAVKSKIAAGEVVEGPFSVLKELLENSLDAGATAIDVEVEESGLKKIAVRDDGEGIRRDDIVLVAREHATSKMRRIEDIESIATYGFRGEALSSIASISKLSVLSRRRGEDLGARLSGDGGDFERGDYAGPAGTTVIAENLFYNVPARKKFMRSRPAELRFLREVFLRAALSSPGVSFTLTVDGKRQNVFPAAADRGERIGQVYGGAVRKHLLEERLADIRVEVEGFLSGPGFSRPSRTLQLLFVNNRHVEYRTLGFLLTKAYESLLRRGEHPAAIIFIAIEPTLVDVNVHPAKREVRFFDQGYINGLIMNLAKKALGARAHRVDTGLFSKAGSGDYAREADPPGPGGNRGGDIPRPGNETPSLTNAPLFPGGARDLVSDGRTLYGAIESGGTSPMLGVIFDTYILAEDSGSLVIIDYHAAHERFIFDRLMADDQDAGTQGLIFPHAVDLTPLECSLVMDNLAHFSAAGFEVGMIGEGALAVRGVPAAARGLDLDLFFRDMLDSLDSRQGTGGPQDWKKLIAEKAACHAAKRAGDGLSTGDARMIAEEALSGRHELRCPHGRPYLFRLGKDDVEKMFKRK